MQNSSRPASGNFHTSDAAVICQGLNIVELGAASMSSSLAGMVFADNGARVVKIEPPGGDRLRVENPSGFLVWNRGKESMVLDLHTADGRHSYLDLAARADVIIEAFSPGIVEGWQVGYDEIAASNPAVIYCSITAFGRTGPYSRLKGYEALVAAKLGLYARGEFAPRNGPIMFPQPSASFGAAMQAVSGIAAALIVRTTSGIGQRLDATLARGLEPVDYYMSIVTQIAAKGGRRPANDARAVAGMAATRFGLLGPARDGRLVQTATVLPRQGQALTKAVGLGHLLEEPDNARLPTFASADAAQAWEDAVLEVFRTKDAAEWADIMLRNPDVPFEIVVTSEQGTLHPQIVHNADVITVNDRDLGPIREVGPIAHFERSPSLIHRSAPRLNEHGDIFARELGEMQKTGVCTGSALQGVTIVDFGYFYAMPYGLAMAASLGARVIKLEDRNGDPIRSSFGPEIASSKTMAGKESISLDLHSDAGRKIAHQIVARSDAFVVGFRPGVTERLGLDYEALSKIKSDLVYLHATGYGIDGPYSARPMYAQSAQTVAGSFGRQVGRWLDPELIRALSVMEYQAVVAPHLAHVTDGDSNAALAVLAALTLGIYHQRRTGEGQFISTSMISGNAYAYSDDFCTYDGKPPARLTDEDHLGLDALHRVYETQNGWICLVVATEAEWRALVDLLSEDQLRQVRFSSQNSRSAHQGELVEILEQVFRQRKACDWERYLSAADVGCVEVNGDGQGVVTSFDPSLRIAGLTQDVDHPLHGGLVMWSPIVAFSKTPGSLRPACLRGEHNRPILTELGYDDVAIEALERSGVVTVPDQHHSS